MSRLYIRQLPINYDTNTLRASVVARDAGNRLRRRAHPPNQVEPLLVQPPPRRLSGHSWPPQYHTSRCHQPPTTSQQHEPRHATMCHHHTQQRHQPHPPTPLESPAPSDTKMSQPHTSNSPAVITELSPHIGSSTPDTTVSPPPATTPLQHAQLHHLLTPSQGHTDRH